MLIVFDCYNLENQPYLLDKGKIYRGLRDIKGTEMYILTKDKKLKPSKVIKTAKRYTKRGWLLRDSYLVITYYYRYNKETQHLELTLSVYRPLLHIIDTVYYIKDNSAVTATEKDKLSTFGKNTVQKLIGSDYTIGEVMQYG